MSDLKESFVRACLVALKKESPGEISLRSISKKVGVSPMAVYRHFPSKKDLFAEISKEGFEKLSAEIKECVQLFPYDPALQIEEVGVRYIKLALKCPEHLKVMFGGVIEDHEEFPSLDECSHRTFEGLVQIVVSGQLAKQFPLGDPIPMAVSAWSVVHGFSMLLVQNQLNFLNITQKNYEPMARNLSRIMTEGLKNYQK